MYGVIENLLQGEEGASFLMMFQKLSKYLCLSV